MTTPELVGDLFSMADEALVSLWRVGGSIEFRGDPSPELIDGLQEHRGDVLAALTAYPGGRREPGADDLTATDQAESGLPPVLAEHERDKWTADLSRMWSRGVPGREAAETAHKALVARINESSLDAARAGGVEAVSARRARPQHSTPGCAGRMDDTQWQQQH